MDVMSELANVGRLYQSNDFSTGLGELRRIWAGIPEPKIDTPNAYLVVEYGVAFALKASDLDEAQKWAAFASDFAKVRHDLGEVEFLVGKVAFERGELELAKESFAIAYAKSEGRVFEAKDEKYLKLIR